MIQLEGAMVILPADRYHFSYRHSIFRGSQMGRYCITAITIRLSRRAHSRRFTLVCSDISMSTTSPITPQPFAKR